MAYIASEPWTDTIERIEHLELWERLSGKVDQEARHALVEFYARVVKYVAGRMAIGLPHYVDQKDLVSAGLLDSRVDGRYRRYRANRKACGPMAPLLERMWSDSLWKLKLLAELEHSRRGPRAASRKRTRS